MDKRSVGGRAVVVGAGVMGAQIAAHLANAGWTADLLDIPGPDGARSKPASSGYECATKLKPPPLYLKELGSRIRAGNIEDDLDRIAGADWVVEAVVERPAIKAQILEAIEAHLDPRTIVTTNTSGLSIQEMAAARSASFKSRFFGTTSSTHRAT